MNSVRHETHMLYLSRKDLEEVDLPLSEMLGIVEDSFAEKGKGGAIMEPKHWYDWGKDRFFSAMSAYTPAFGAAGVKWQSGVPDNPVRNLPYISGYLILNNLEDGLPIAIMDSTWITGKRTGIQTAVSAKYLARSDSEILAMLGCGLQGRTNLQALLLVLPKLKHVQAFDIKRTNLMAYKDFAENLGLEATPCTNQMEAIFGADVIVTAGSIHQNPTDDIESAWLKDGVLAVPLDYDSYWNAEALKGFDKLFVDDIPQVLHYQKTGSFFRDIPEINAEFSQVVTGENPGREANSEKIMCMNLGVATEDMAIAIEIFRRADERGIGVWLRR